MKRFAFLVIVLVLVTTGVAVAQTEFIVLAGGCFWCVEEAFDKHDGVVATTSGFAGGTVANPSYRQVTAGGTGHIEVVRVEYDPAIIDLDELLYIYWRNVDPLDPGGQFCDRGEIYSTAIFYVTEDQRQASERTKREVARRFSTTVATTIRPHTVFYPAEEYHQNYHSKNPVQYWYYRTACGRYDRLDQLWGDEARGER